jgi:SAM-dependent methyltransferase
MEAMSLTETLLEQPLVYRLWQAPFVAQKFAPVLAHNNMHRINRVLDVGCGPGTNTSQFARTVYLGIDINEDYIKSARKRHRRDFVAADARTYRTAPENRFDFILVNSFLHHIATTDVVELLSHLRTLLTDDGSIHILDLVLPAPGSIARFLSDADRGRFVRPLEDWKSIFAGLFHPVVFETFPLTGVGLTLWEMLYFKGNALK